MKQIIAAALLAITGFTVSLFFAELVFAGQAGLVLQAKLGITLASAMAGITAYIWLQRLEANKPEAQLKPAKAAIAMNRQRKTEARTR